MFALIRFRARVLKKQGVIALQSRVPFNRSDVLRVCLDALERDVPGSCRKRRGVIPYRSRGGVGRMTGDDAGGFDAEDAREGHSGCEALAGVQLEVVKSECALTRSPDAAELSMAVMTSWRRTASAKSGTVRVPLPRSAANAA
ncbi:MAG: hypothetical protein QOE10_2963 [Gaiellales bacterium]|nr:hypothetical protein [Gaiellales bacterium]